jgi:hypothetical protein
MATLLKVLNNLADIKSAGVLHFASELRAAERVVRYPERVGIVVMKRLTWPGLTSPREHSRRCFNRHRASEAGSTKTKRNRANSRVDRHRADPGVRPPLMYGHQAGDRIFPASRSHRLRGDLATVVTPGRPLVRALGASPRARRPGGLSDV